MYIAWLAFIKYKVVFNPVHGEVERGSTLDVFIAN
jgi:hypothetical protein